ncbi:MAG TPA: hypothetical protein VKY65_06260 [Alphaproteobacteria bacterium]|nr:hypothetical protein [Alphaproteobacteria bacterium]
MTHDIFTPMAKRLRASAAVLRRRSLTTGDEVLELVLAERCLLLASRIEAYAEALDGDDAEKTSRNPDDRAPAASHMNGSKRPIIARTARAAQWDEAIHKAQRGWIASLPLGARNDALS